ncbi:hypothetical protein LEL_07319 [Akanthomyces lecanii RCEF 1005]|uniref:DUF1749-domain-containing protein n=1 Tax=Akanthomyces lecanii RCEF 1005 TaxID=1081108 RepID=A0A168FL80_CORDF|nr:hypothetical protein LEL_07319 [Akanthomyces lecanii RCEF 1005]
MTPQQPHSVLFVGGMGDGLGTSSYTSDIVRALQPTKWSFFTLNLSSSHSQWGLGHLARDTQEISECVEYIKYYKTAKYGDHNKLVIMGHSTGSQCVLNYLSQPNPITAVASFDHELKHGCRPVVDGAIMQAPVSDREAILSVLRDGFAGRSADELKAIWGKAEHFAKSAVKSESQSIDTLIPLWMTAPVYSNVPISCRRFLSLTSPDSPQEPGADDMFSSDLSNEELGKTFGMVAERGLLKSKLMVLMSGRDLAVPDWVDKEQLLLRWKCAANKTFPGQTWDESHSGIIPGASHALSDPDQAEPRRWLANKILSYLGTIDGQSS